MPQKIITKLYVLVKKGSGVKPGELCHDFCERADYLTLANGDSVGVVHANDSKARDLLTEAGVTVLDFLHRPASAEHIKAFAHAGAQEGDYGHDIAMKLYNTHKMHWMHPENSP